jgi:predicted lipoprotein with Yx(FWY)xxD motif
MVFVKRPFYIAVGFLLMLVVSACGSSTSTGSSATQSTPTVAPTTASTAQVTPTSTSSVVVQTATATIDGKTETILTTAQGLTLYYFTPDTASKTACTGGCASAWPPLLFTGSGKPAASTKLPGELEVYPNANGKQIIYNDHPLYTFGGDTAPGQTNGNGVGGKWFVVTLDLPKNK